jgi:DNA-binding response OmpR family regulator
MRNEILKVMVVDDSQLVLERLRQALGRAGHTVSLRDSSLGTVAAVLRERPDVLILDVSMPALDGPRLAALVGEVTQDVTLILHSARDERELEALSARAGAHGYIKKTNDSVLFLVEFNRIVFSERLSRPGDPVSGVLRTRDGKRRAQ